MADATTTTIETAQATEPRVRRQFAFGGTTLADPDPAKSPADALKHFAANGYPTLANGAVTGPEIKDGKHIYALKASVGTKG